MQQDLESYISGWRNRIKKQKSLEMRRFNEARKSLPDIIKILKKYEVKEIILFGSLTTINQFNYHSDIDIAVKGLDPGKFFKAYGELMLKIDFPVDLKPFEKLEPFFKQQIISSGEIIYGSKKAREPGASQNIGNV